MIDMIQTAKDLIKQGEMLGDAELISMGMTMLEKYKKPQFQRAGNAHPEDFSMLDLIPEDEVELPDEDEVDDLPEIYYECSSCHAIMPYDKEGRRKCMSCKKLSLVVMHRAVEQEKPQRQRATADDFKTQIRKKVPRSRVRYGENGEVEGIYTRAEPVEGITNVWNDDGSEGFDKQNEQLKSLTKVSPRTRPPVKMVRVVCDECKTVHMEHPMHAGGRARFLCNKCMKKRSRV